MASDEDADEQTPLFDVAVVHEHGEERARPPKRYVEEERWPRHVYKATFIAGVLIIIGKRGENIGGQGVGCGRRGGRRGRRRGGGVNMSGRRVFSFAPTPNPPSSPLAGAIFYMSPILTNEAEASVDQLVRSPSLACCARLLLLCSSSSSLRAACRCAAVCASILPSVPCVRVRLCVRLCESACASVCA